jgi:hypothetical protein
MGCNLSRPQRCKIACSLCQSCQKRLEPLNVLDGLIEATAKPREE